MVTILANTPPWVIDAKNWAGLIASFVGAFGLVWRYAIKPYLEHREAERKRDLADAQAMRKGEITVALIPVQESLRVLQADVNRIGDKSMLQGDAIHGINAQLETLTRESRSLHTDVREHMRAEEERDRKPKGESE